MRVSSILLLLQRIRCSKFQQPKYFSVTSSPVISSEPICTNIYVAHFVLSVQTDELHVKNTYICQNMFFKNFRGRITICFEKMLFHLSFLKHFPNKYSLLEVKNVEKMSIFLREV